MSFKPRPWLRSCQNLPDSALRDQRFQRSKKSKRRRAMRLELDTLEIRVVPSGNWTALSMPMPAGDGADVMMLLSDGRVMVKGGGNATSSAWYGLSPDSAGHYVGGTWTQLNSMNLQRLYFPANVLRNGNVLVAGG